MKSNLKHLILICFAFNAQMAFAADDVVVVDGDCDQAVKTPAGYALAGVSKHESKSVNSMYNSSYGYPYNDCNTLTGGSGEVIRGQCVSTERSCSYTFKKSSSATASAPSDSRIKVIENDCSVEPQAPNGFHFLSVNSEKREREAAQYNSSFGYPYNDCHTLLGLGAYVENGRCIRTDKVCSYSFIMDGVSTSAPTGAPNAPNSAR